MRSISFLRMLGSHWLAAIGVAVWTSSHAGEVIGQMTGTGGLMRDAERRVLDKVPQKEAGKLPDVMSAGNSGKPSKAAGGKVMGEIKSINAFGSKKFAADTGIGERLLAELKGEGAKNAGEVSNAIAKVRQDLIKEGYLLLRLSLARENAYDAKTKTLSVLVEQGSFGEARRGSGCAPG